MSFARLSRVKALIASASMVVAACHDGAAPTGADALSRTASMANASVAGRYLVHLQGDAIPAGFADRIASLGGTLEASLDGAGMAVVSGLSAENANALASDAGVVAVDPDNVFRALEEPSAVALMDATDVSAASPGNPATAFLYPFQWNMRVIQADAAWAAGHLGSPSVKVAILDSGIDYLHPDLNGRVDLASSASFVPAENVFVTTFFPGRAPFTDLLYHGTHVAAIVSSNALLSAGVTSQTTLMAVKVMDITGNVAMSALVSGFVHAVNRGADVINMSLGVKQMLDRKDQEIHAFERAMNRLFQMANREGVTIVVAAGNEAQDMDTNQTLKLFCGMDHVICVSATGPTSQGSNSGPWHNIDAQASYSNFGHRSVDVAAPGGNGATAVWGPCSTSSLVLVACQTALLGIGAQGTSAAAPHVSGEVALLLARNPNLKPSQLRARIANTADDTGKRGKDDAYGMGRINVRRAVQ